MCCDFALEKLMIETYIIICVPYHNIFLPQQSCILLCIRTNNTPNRQFTQYKGNEHVKEKLDRFGLAYISVFQSSDLPKNLLEVRDECISQFIGLPNCWWEIDTPEPSGRRLLNILSRLTSMKDKLSLHKLKIEASLFRHMEANINPIFQIRYHIARYSSGSYRNVFNSEFNLAN